MTPITRLATPKGICFIATPQLKPPRIRCHSFICLGYLRIVENLLVSMRHFHNLLVDLIIYNHCQKSSNQRFASLLSGQQLTKIGRAIPVCSRKSIDPQSLNRSRPYPSVMHHKEFVSPNVLDISTYLSTTQLNNLSDNLNQFPHL